MTVAPPSEERAQLRRRLVLENAAKDLDPVIDRSRPKDVDDAPGGPAFGIGASINEALNAGRHHRARAHRAWLLRDVNGPASSPRPQAAASLAERQDFRVGGWVVPPLLLVFCLDDEVAGYEHCPDRHIATHLCKRGQRQSAPDPILVGHAPPCVDRQADSPSKKSGTAERARSAAEMARPEGFEPPTSAFGGLRSIQLRYGRSGRPGTFATLISRPVRFFGLRNARGFER